MTKAKATCVGNMCASYILFSLSLAIGCLITGSKLARRGYSTACIPFLQWSFISMGLVFLVAFILFVVIAFCSNQDADNNFKDTRRVVISLWLHSGIKCLGLVVFLCLLIFALKAIEIKTTGSMEPEAYKFDINGMNIDPIEVMYRVRDYNLSDYGGLLRRRMADARYWATISECLRHRHACDGMSPMVRAPNTSFFSKQGLSPIQSGCCKPPLSCAFTYVNQTMWTPTPTQGAPTNNTNDDCSRWSNDKQTLCFQCDSCKAAVLADIQTAWRMPVLVVITIVIMQILILPCFVWWIIKAEK